LGSPKNKKRTSKRCSFFLQWVPTGYACILCGFFASVYTLAMLAFTVFVKTVNQAVPIFIPLNKNNFEKLGKIDSQFRISCERIKNGRALSWNKREQYEKRNITVLQIFNDF